MREFIHADDLANAIYTCLKVNKNILKNKFKSKLPILNVIKQQISIKNLSKLIYKYINFNGKNNF